MEGQQKQSGHAQGAGDYEKAKATEVEEFEAFYEKVSSNLGIRMPNNYDLAKAAIEEGKLEILKDCCCLRMPTDDLFEHLLIDAVMSGSLEMVMCVVEEQVRAIDRRAPLLGGRKWTQPERFRFLDGHEAYIAMELGHYRILDYLHEIKKKCHCHRRWSQGMYFGPRDHTVQKTKRPKYRDRGEKKDWFWPAVINGDVQGLQWLLDHGYGVLFTKGKVSIRYMAVENIPECLAEHGHLEALKWWKSHNFPWDEATIVQAAFKGRIEVMEWLVENGCPFTQLTYYAATVGEDAAVCLDFANQHQMATLPYWRLREWSARDDRYVQELFHLLAVNSPKQFKKGYNRSASPYIGRMVPGSESYIKYHWKEFKNCWTICCLRDFMREIRERSEPADLLDPEESRFMEEYKTCPCRKWVEGTAEKPNIAEQLGWN